jgi:Ca-activated chloride channel family protein
MSFAALSELHFLRPYWLLALLLVPLLLLWRARQQRASDPWRAVVDAPLLAAQSVGRARAARLPDVLLALGCTIAILALAGPAFRQEPAPILRVQAPLVLALDLSPAMRAADLKPDRLTRARLKLAELVRRREDGQTALVAFSSEAFTVAPLTEDAATLDGLLAALDPSVLPVAGQRPARALQRAQGLIGEATGEKGSRGEVLLVTDHADAAAIDAAARLAEAGIRVSVLGIGTPEGAPVPAAGGGFLMDASGNIRLPRLDESSLRELASAGGGRYARLTADDRDLRALGLDQIGTAAQAVEAGADARLRYRDEGPLLLLVLLPLAALAARRGWLLSLPLVLVLPLAGTHSAQAQTSAPSTPSESAPVVPGSTSPASTAPAAEVGGLGQFWNDLWQRRDRQAWEALQDNAPARAAELARDPALQGAAAYRAGDYARALSALEAVQGADAAYNRGNALAKLQRFEEALDAYDQALAAEPEHADAAANRAAVEAWLQQQQQQQKGDPQQGDQQQDGEQQDGEQGEPSQDGSQSQQQGQSPQDASQQNESQQDGEPSPSDAEQGDPTDESQPASDPGDEAPPSEQQPSSDAQQQAQEQAAYNEAMQQALEQSPEEAEPASEAAELSAEEISEAERQQALQQLLRRVPDDPGGLLRRKFLLEYQRRQREGDQ